MRQLARTREGSDSDLGPGRLTLAFVQGRSGHGIQQAQNGGPAPARDREGSAARRATERQILEDAEHLVAVWNERQAKLRRVYQDAMSIGSGTVSLTISHRSEWQIFLSGCASLCRNTTMLWGWNTTTKSPPSRPIDTCRRGGNRVLPDVAPLSTDICNPRTTDQCVRSVAVAGAKPLAAWRLIHKRQCAGVTKIPLCRTRAAGSGGYYARSRRNASRRT
jgi:hypothetical protein